MSTTSGSTEPSAIWSTRRMVFDESLSCSQNVIISHGRFALQAAVEKIDALYGMLGFMANLMDAYPHPGIPHTLTEICAHHGIASSILLDGPERKSDESARFYRLRMERFSYVKEKCNNAGISIRILSDRTVRNRMIHVDSYLEKAMQSPDTGWFIDIAIAYRDQFRAPRPLKVAFCRTFIVSEEKILHLGSEISVKDLRQEAVDVLACVFGTPPSEPPSLPAYSHKNHPPQRP